MRDLSYITYLTKKYESGGNPACVSDGEGDLGGISYGLYQLSSESGSVDAFIDFCIDYEDEKLANYGRVLRENPVNSEEFIEQWKLIGTVDSDGFEELQDAYAVDTYYDMAVLLLAKEGYHADRHSEAMESVIMSRAIQYGSYNTVDLFSDACSRLGYDNLSYVDDVSFDSQVIQSIYDLLIEECDNARQDKAGMYHSPEDWVNGSRSVVFGLRNRFSNEKQDALCMLRNEGV